MATATFLIWILWRTGSGMNSLLWASVWEWVMEDGPFEAIVHLWQPSLLSKYSTFVL